ncbi:MAG: tetratricopeptide repeat protein, partial [Betaproteobacteria bacterium]|nr:tetratricopeptide repeat protein [Betaproteobacteria bacterium]
HALLAASADPALQAPGLGVWLHRETEGHPFFLVSILQSILEQGSLAAENPSAWRAEALAFPPAAVPTLPEALRDSVRSRVARVPREVRSILDVAAVLGRRFDFDTLRAVTREPASTLLDSVDTLVERNLLREEEDSGLYDFSHDKIREAVYLDIGSTRRMLLHRAVAEALEPLASSETKEHAARLAQHYERAQVWTKAVTYLIAAAHHSQSLFATRETLGLLDRAVALVEAHPTAAEQGVQLQLYEQRGAARALAGQMQGAVADFERVIDAARAARDRMRERDLLIQLGMAYRRSDSYDRATECLAEALEASRAMHDDRHTADTLYHLGTVAWSDCRNAEAIEYHQEAVEICERLKLTDLVAVQAFHGRGEAYFADAQPEPAIECYARSIELAQSIGDKSYECENLMMIGWACIGYMGLGDYPRAAKNLEAGLTIARAADFEWHMGPLLIAQDHVRSCLGDYSEAWDGLNETLRRLEALKLVRYQIMAYNMLGYVLLDLNLFTEAADRFEQGLQVASDAKITYWTPLLQANLAIARTRMGRLDVQAELEQALSFAQARREGWFSTRCLEGLAEISLARGNTGQCLAYADELLRLAKGGKLREMMARAHRWRGEAFLADKAYGPAASELYCAAELSAQLGRLRLAWDVHCALARLCGGGGRPHEANNHQLKAQEIAARIASNLRGSDLKAALPACE